MPCTYTGSLDGDTIHAQAEGLNAQRKEIEKLSDELNLVTRLLCSLVKRVPSRFLDGDAELKAWAAKHKIADKKRVENEHQRTLKKVQEAEAALLKVRQELEIIELEKKELEE